MMYSYLTITTITSTTIYHLPNSTTTSTTTTTGVRKEDSSSNVQPSEALTSIKKAKSLLDPDALACVSEDGADSSNAGKTNNNNTDNNSANRRPSFEAEMFGDIPSNAAEALMNDKELENA